MLKTHLLSTTAVFAPPDDRGAPGPDNEEDRIEVDLDDDEGDQSLDPIDEEDQADDDAGDDQDDAASAAGGDPPAGGRGDRAVGALRADRRRLSEDNARLTRELAEARRAPAPVQQQQPLETAAQRAERLALMSPEERTEAIVTEALDRNNRQQMVLTNQLLDQGDKATFDSRCLSNPLFKKLASEVETRLQDLRSKGQNLPRETIATFLIGERAVAQLGKGKPGAQQRRRAQETRPNNGRGDVGSDRRERRGTGDAVRDMEARFGDVPI